jgi:hypothetical protein
MAWAPGPRRLAGAAVIGASTAALAAACGAPDGGATPPPGSDSGSVVFGVTSDLRVGTDFDALRVLTRVNGVTTGDQTRTRAAGTLALPAEVTVGPRPAGDLVDVALTASSSTVKGLRVERRASTTVLGGRTLFLPLGIDEACLALDVPGGHAPPTCAAAETCAGGACVPVAVNPASLATYDPGWLDQEPADVCRSADAGPPEVIVGQGQADYLPVDACDAASPEPAQVEAGPQGGHHVWVALRVKGIHQSGAVTTVRGHFPDLAKDPWDMAVIFAFEPDEGGYCKLYGIRYQLDTNGLGLSDVLGQRIELTVEVKDRDGVRATGTRCIVLSSESI